MRFLKLTVLTAIAAFVLWGCEKSYSDNIKVNNGIVLNGGQMVPSNQTTGSGIMDIWYDQKAKVLNYAVRWSGLSDSVIAVRVHGPAERGVNAAVIQNITPTTLPNAQRASTGFYSGSLVVDGVVVREEDVINSRLYLVLPTKTRTTGEVRGQILVP